MRVITKNEQNNLLGSGSFWFPKRAPGSLTYLQGVPEFDAIRASTGVQSPFNLEVRPGGLAISIMHQFKKYYAALPFAHVVTIALETPGSIYANKENSVFGRALLGGIIAGPIGALVEGIIALQDSPTALAQASLLTVAVAGPGGPGCLVASIEPGLAVTTLRQWLHRQLGAHCPQ